MNALTELLEAIRSYCAENLPGEVPLDVRITLASGRKVQHPVPVLVAPPPTRQLAPARHSEDYHSVHWHGRDYVFSDTQAACVKALWEAWEDGTPELAQATILVAADSTADRLRDVFRTSPAWGTLIVPGTLRGTFRLAAPL